MKLKETLLESLVRFLKETLGKNVDDYSFRIQGSGRTLDYGYLKEYLETSNIPYSARGVSLPSQQKLPQATVVSDDDAHPFGLYLICPDTDREIILYFYQLLDSDYRGDTKPRLILGFKNDKAADDFVSGYREFGIKKVQKKDTICVFRGEDLSETIHRLGGHHFARCSKKGHQKQHRELLRR